MVNIEIWSDFMCPFCYIGKRKLESALNLFEGKQHVKIVWKSYQLDPNLQANKYSTLNEYLAIAKNIPLTEAQQINNYVKGLAEKVNLKFNLESLKVSNTLKAHQLSHLAKLSNKQNQLEEALFNAYFTDGKNLDDIQTLIEIGKSCDLNQTEIENTFKENKFLNDIAKDIEEAQYIGVTGVPFFVFNNKYGLSGAQEIDVFLESLDKIYRDRKIQLAKEGAKCDVNGICK